MPARALDVWVNGTQVGQWRVPARGSMEFQYESDWINSKEGRPLSLSMPFTIDNSPLTGKSIENYFENLLPDSATIRKRLQTRFQTASAHAFDLLTAIGRDCIGAVQLLAVDEKPVKVRTISATALSKAQVATELSRMLSPSVNNFSEDEFRISIAGAQEKLAFLRHNGKWCRPLGATPTTHIFKLPLGLVGNMRADMSSSVENEWLCSRILAAYDVPVAACKMDRFGEYKVLIVERFDRVLHSSGKYWLRLVQEDMCQATGAPDYKKYEADGGPGNLAIARILQASTQRDQDLITLFKAQLLFWMLAATDGHAKNFSIRILAGGRYQLTPLYDVLSAWPVIGNKASQIPVQKARLAMAIHARGAHYKIKEIQRRHFHHLAKQMGIGNAAGSIIDETIELTPRVIDTVTNELPHDFPTKVSNAIFAGLKNSARQLATMPIN
jgi:serine/threonine-protein kinase HipA